MNEVIHIVGLDVQVAARFRQRCAWCGAVIEDVPLDRVAVPEGQDPSSHGWEVGALVSVQPGRKSVVPHESGAKLPDACCAMLDPDATI